MKKIQLIFVYLILSASCSNHPASGLPGDKREIVEKISNQLAGFPEFSTKPENRGENIFPRSVDHSGTIRYVGREDWTSGFYPGILWLMHELTGDTKWKTEAIYYTELLESEKMNASNHDLGFKMMSSFGNGYRLTNNIRYRETLIQSARTLITRFNEKVGCIRSWDHHTDKWEYPVIIDNLMNLELLFRAWRETGEPVFYNIAVKHAETTMKNHFRNDYSSYHVVGYDPETGEVTARNTHQGYSDESSWARGQAWALYGYTMVYRETRNPVFLSQAEKIADYIISSTKIREGEIPVWDFDVRDQPGEPYDASAGAIISSALFELQNYSKNRADYYQIASQLLETLSSPFFFSDTNKTGFLLKHSTGSKPQGSEVDVPLIYADYYFLEAIQRKIEADKTLSNYVIN
jgi:unsaturated chondroitin disaccharide hydrolase